MKAYDYALFRIIGIELSPTTRCEEPVYVAYEARRNEGAKKVLIANVNSYSYVRRVESYEFYIASEKANSLKTLFTMEDQGESVQYHVFDSVTNCVSSDGYRLGSDKDNKDAGLGSIGKFVVYGYTAETKENEQPVFLKNVGDQMVLSYALMKDIDHLSNKPELSIAKEGKQRDLTFRYPDEPVEFGRGALLIKFTDSHNEAHYIAYTNFLEAYASPTANIQIELNEEGKYEVLLDYKVREKKTGLDSFSYYQAAFSFRVQNSNTKSYFFDGRNGNELMNMSTAKNGIHVDFAGNTSLLVSVTRSILVKNGNKVAVEDRRNEAVSAGKEFTEPGIYSFTIKNDYTGREEHAMFFFPGDDPLLNAYVYSDCNSIDELNGRLKEGWKIKDGKLVAPVSNKEKN